METHLLFIDYEKAFENVQRQILFNIFKSGHFPDTLLKAILDIYTQNKILIKFNNKLSKLIEINAGVRQGCPLSPTLFNIYLDEIITKWCVWVRRGGCIGSWWGNRGERDHWGELGVDGWIILGRICGMWVYGLDWAGPG